MLNSLCMANWGALITALTGAIFKDFNIRFLHCIIQIGI
jgi:hypothetical protein